MAKRTINRNPFSVDTDGYELNKQYFNFTEFKGINSNKNYVKIDQQSFEEADNVYVNQDGELSTRPVVKAISVIPADEKVVQMYKVNNLVIYQTQLTDETYLIRFTINGRDYSRATSKKMHITWYKDKYIMFQENDIIGWSYDYSVTDPNTDPLTWYSVSQIVYKPITEIIQGSTKVTNESANIFTSGHVVRYDFETGIATITTGLEGKTVTIHIDDEVFDDFVWQENSEIILTKPLGKVNVNVIQCASASLDAGTFRYFAYNAENSGVPISNGNLFLSLDGDAFVTMPVFAHWQDCIFTLSDDGSTIFAYTVEASKHAWNGIYWYTIPASAQNIQATVWQQQLFSMDDRDFEANKAANGRNNSGRIHHVANTSLCYPFAHSPDAGHVVFVMGMNLQWENKQDSSFVWSDPSSSGGTRTSGTFEGLGIVICNTLGNRFRIQVYPLFNFVSRPFGSNYSSVRFVDVSNGSKYITIFAAPNDGVIVPYYITLKSDYTPYMAIQFRSGFVSPVIMEYAPTTGTTYRIDTDTTRRYGCDIVGTYRTGVERLLYRYAGKVKPLSTLRDGYVNIAVRNIGLISGYNSTDYILKYAYTSGYADGHRDDYPVTFDVSFDTSAFDGDIDSHAFKLPLIYTDTAIVLTDKYFWYSNTALELLARKYDDTNYASNIPLWIDQGGRYFGYYATELQTVYSNYYDGHIYVDLDEDGTYNYLIPEFSADLVDKIFTIQNKLYWSTSIEQEGSQLLYVSEKNVEEFEDIITNVVVFSQTSLGIFLSNSVYEFQCSSTLTESLGMNVYLVMPTKLQMGCKKGSSIVIAYSSSSILLTNIKGLTTLTYQDFVQSTEQVFSYLTEPIMSDYYRWANGPIKLYQYKDWLFMYQTDVKVFYVLDMRNASWWRWETIYPIQQLLNVDEQLYLIYNDKLYEFDFDAFSVYDDGVHPINWRIVSQKLHFNAPNYYKVVNQLSVITTRSTDDLRYKLSFVNYRNLQNLVDTDTVEFEVDQLATLIKRVTFMKLNAFQFAISNDKTNNSPTPFITSDIAIQYRITERVR